MSAYLALGANTCCGCSTPMFLGLFDDRDDAEEAAVAHDGDAKVIPYTGAAVTDWGGDPPWQIDGEPAEPLPIHPRPITHGPMSPHRQPERQWVADEPVAAGEIARGGQQ